MAKSHRYDGYVISPNGPRGDDRMSAAQKQAMKARKARMDKLENDRLCSELGIYDLRNEVLNDGK